MVEFVYKCGTCGKRWQRQEVRYLCPSCASDYRPGFPLAGVLTVEFDYAAIQKQFKKAKPDWNLFSAVLPGLRHGNDAVLPVEGVGR